MNSGDYGDYGQAPALNSIQQTAKLVNSQVTPQGVQEKPIMGNPNVVATPVQQPALNTPIAQGQPPQYTRQMLENFTEEDWRKLTPEQWKQLQGQGLATEWGRNDVNVDGYDKGEAGYSYKYDNGDIRSYHLDQQRTNMQGVTDRAAPTSEGAKWGSFLRKFVLPAAGAYGIGTAYNAANGMAGASLAEGAASQAAVGASGAAPGYGTAVAAGANSAPALATTAPAAATMDSMYGPTAGQAAPAATNAAPALDVATKAKAVTEIAAEKGWGQTAIDFLTSPAGAAIASSLINTWSANKSGSAQMDKYEEDRAYQQQYRDQINETYTNPQKFLDSPEYQAAQKITHNRLQRSDAAAGNLANDASRQKLMQDHAFAYLDNYRKGLRDTERLGNPNIQNYVDGTNQYANIAAPLLTEWGKYNDNKSAPKGTSGNVSFDDNGKMAVEYT